MSSDSVEQSREYYGELSVDDEDQLQQGDTLDDRNVDDVLDEGYSPPDRQPASHRFGTTVAEQRSGETLEQRLAQEELEPDPYRDGPMVEMTLEPRAGRLVDPDEGFGTDRESTLVGRDVGMSGGFASAEEAAMHVVDEDHDRASDEMDDLEDDVTGER